MSWILWTAVFLAFGCVSAQLQVAMEPAPSPKPCQKPKILAAHRYIFSVNAPEREKKFFLRRVFVS